VLPQAEYMNRGAGSHWAALERELRAFVRDGRSVRMDVELRYLDRNTLRPHEWQIKYWVDGKLQPLAVIFNE